MAATRPDGSKASFQTFGLSAPLLRAISDVGFESPRPIQAKTIPAVLDGRDVLGLAQTGTGKTAAFALPILERLAATRGRSPRCLILAPTRELAIQIHAETTALGKYTQVRATTVFGGVAAGAQVRALRARPDIVVACPGRLLDLAGSGDVDLSGVETLVLDEADHMFDMGFLPDIRRILKLLPERRQNLLFSATMPKEIRGLAERVLHDPHTVELTSSAPADTIDHALYPVEQARKTALLHHLLGQKDFRSAIVFLRTKHRARRLARDLERSGLRAIALQGNMSQNQRQRAMQGFRDGHYNVLVATDIAARGIDVAKVSHVINYDLPNTPDAYTHRIGRTGRAEESGKACTFVSGEDWGGVKDIERKLGMQIQRVRVDGYGDGARETATREPREPRESRQAGSSGGGRRPKGAGPGRRSRGGSKPGQAGGRRRAEEPAAEPRTRRIVGAGVQAARTSGRQERPAGPGFGAGLDGHGHDHGPSHGAVRRGAAGGSRGGRPGAAARSQGLARQTGPGRRSR